LELVDRDAVFAQCLSSIRTYIWHAVRSLSTTNSFVAQLVRRLLASTFSSAPSPPPPRLLIHAFLLQVPRSRISPPLLRRQVAS